MSTVRFTLEIMLKLSSGLQPFLQFFHRIVAWTASELTPENGHT